MSEKEQEQADLDARLWNAARTGDAEAVVRLAGEGASADAKGGDWDSPAVAEAAYEGHTEVVEALLRLGCDPNAPGPGGGTALMSAASWGHGGVVGALLEHVEKGLDAVDDYGWTALMWAAFHGHAAIAAQLVKAGGDATLCATGGNHEGKTALEIAETEGKAEVVALLSVDKKELKHKLIDELQSDNKPKDGDAVETLLLLKYLDKTAELKSVNEAKCQQGDLDNWVGATASMDDVVVLSAEDQATLDAQLFIAVERGDVAKVKELAGEGASVDAQDEGDNPVVFLATSKGRKDVVEALLLLGCDPNAKDEYHDTALMLAAVLGHGDVVTALLNGGAAINAVDKYGQTALMRAVINGQAAVAEQLVKAGADATLRATGGYYEGKTAHEIMAALEDKDSGTSNH